MTEKFVQVDGFKTRYLEEGKGPAVLLLHGASLGSSADVFERGGYARFAATRPVAGDGEAMRLVADFLDQVTAALAPDKCAVLADISEEWVTPIDTKMELLGGTVYRTPRKSFEKEQRARDVAALRAEIDELKAEHAQARADRKAKIQASIDKLSARLQGKFHKFIRLQRAKFPLRILKDIEPLILKAAHFNQGQFF